MKTIDVRYEFDDERRLWSVFADGVPSGHSVGRSVREAREMIREAVALVFDIDTEDVAVEREVYVLPGELGDVVGAARVAKAAAEAGAEAARTAQGDAVADLRAAGLTVRDTGEVLGISFQRVQQVQQVGDRTKRTAKKGTSTARRRTAARSAVERRSPR